MHDVVVMAVRKAVSAATTTFTAISTIRFLDMFFFCEKSYQLLVTPNFSFPAPEEAGSEPTP